MKKKQYIYPLVDVVDVKTVEVMAFTNPTFDGPSEEFTGSKTVRRTPVF